MGQGEHPVITATRRLVGYITPEVAEEYRPAGTPIWEMRFLYQGRELVRQAWRHKTIPADILEAELDCAWTLLRDGPEYMDEHCDDLCLEGEEREVWVSHAVETAAWLGPEAFHVVCERAYEDYNTFSAWARRLCTEWLDLTEIRHEDILACPLVIWVASHYRPDGSCRCDEGDDGSDGASAVESEPDIVPAPPCAE